MTACATCERCAPGLGCVAVAQPFCDPRVPPFVPPTFAKGPASLKLRRGTSLTRNALRWKVAARHDFDDPVTATDHLLCIHDGDGNVLLGARAPAGGTCGRRPCWLAKGQIGIQTIRYVDREGTPDGLGKISSNTKKSLNVKGKGELLAIAPVGGVTPPLHVTLQNSFGRCTGVSFEAGEILRDEPDRLDAKRPLR